MDTPICDFVNKYIDSDFSRFHMPGHKGKEFIGCRETGHNGDRWCGCIKPLLTEL